MFHLCKKFDGGGSDDGTKRGIEGRRKKNSESFCFQYEYEYINIREIRS